MKFAFCLPAVALFSLTLHGARAAPHTPKIGSPQRVAIADSLRSYVAKEIAVRPMPKKVVFKISHLLVSGDFAFFEGSPVFEDGTSPLTDYLPDMAYLFLLQKKTKGWEVIADFCGADVPEPAWWRSKRKNMPSTVPAEIFPEFYRRHLGF